MRYFYHCFPNASTYITQYAYFHRIRRVWVSERKRPVRRGPSSFVLLVRLSLPKRWDWRCLLRTLCVYAWRARSSNGKLPNATAGPVIDPLETLMGYAHTLEGHLAQLARDILLVTAPHPPPDCYFIYASACHCCATAATTSYPGLRYAHGNARR